jgi:hypothetical protein
VTDIKMDGQTGWQLTAAAMTGQSSPRKAFSEKHVWAYRKLADRFALAKKAVTPFCILNVVQRSI